MSLNTMVRYSPLAFLFTMLALGSLLFSSCNTTDGSGQTYLKVHVDTAWFHYDSIQVLIDHGDGSKPVEIFGGKVSSSADLYRLPADGYDGSKVTVVIRGFLGDSLVRAENRQYDGSSQKTINVVLVNGPMSDSLITKDGLVLLLGPTDTLITIRDSVTFRAICRNDSGNVIQADWDFDADGVVDLSVKPNASKANLVSGYRFAKSGLYRSALVIKGSKGATLRAEVLVRVVDDKPSADAGHDTTVAGGVNVTLQGHAKDSLGKIVKQEWQIGTGNFTFTPDGKVTFISPLTSGDLKVVFRATDDDSQSATDTAVVHVAAVTDTGKSGLSLNISPRDTLVTIRDSVMFKGMARNAKGKIIKIAWDLDGDGTVDTLQTLNADSVGLLVGYRFAKAGVYHPKLTVQAETGGILQDSVTVRVVLDPPKADAGPDTSVLANANVSLRGRAYDSLGKIVKQEWQIGGGTFAVTSDGNAAFKAPATAGDVIAVFRVMDDDSLVAVDTAIVHVSLAPDTVKDGLHLTFSPADTLLSIRDSVAYTAKFRNDNGKVTKVEWDLDGDGSVDVTVNPNADSASVTAGFRFAGVGTYHPNVTITGARGASLKATITVRVVEDRPKANAGGDTTVTTGSAVALHGLAKDSLGKIVKQEWSIAGAAYAVTPDGKSAFNAPGTAGDVMAVFRVTDDDSLTGLDTVVVHVVNPIVATLTQLSVQGCLLAPSFSPDSLTYGCAAPYGTSSVTVTAKAQGAMTLNGTALADSVAGAPIPLTAGAASLTLVVTNASATRTYHVNVAAAASSNNSLSALMVSTGAFSPAFTPATLLYSETVSSTTVSMTVTATLADSTANVTVQGVSVVSGKTSAAIPLATGANPIAIVVTAQNGSVKTYTLAVKKQSGIATLKALTVSAGSLAPIFSSVVTDYSVTVGQLTSSFGVTAAPQDTGKATMTLNGAALAANTTLPVTLPTTITVITIMVTAEDTTVKKSYVVTVTKVDDVPPTTPTVVPAPFTAPDRPAFTWTPGGGGNGTFRYKLDDSNLATGATTTSALAYSAASDLPAGVHTLYVQETDTAGNWSASGKATATLVGISTIADYPLEAHGSDTVGANADLTLTNAPFLSQGIYINGIYTGSGGASASDATTPILTGFTPTNFSVEVDFKPDGIPTGTEPVLVGGASYRWIGGLLDADGKISLLYNNSSTVKGSLTCTAAQWHKLKLEYVTGTANVYLDGVLSASVVDTLTTSTDYDFTSTNLSNGGAFKGNLRNLKVISGGVKIAQYPWAVDARDITKKQTVSTLTNAPFQIPGPGVALAGVYSSDLAETPSLTAMNLDEFRVSADFAIAALPSLRMPVFTGGHSYRWLGAAIEPGGTISLLYNNANFLATTTACSIGVKHTVAIRFSAASQVAAIYLDGVFAGSKAITTLTHGNDKTVSTSNFSNSSEFKGSFYRIKVESK